MFPFQLFPVNLFPNGLFDRPKRDISITQTLILADLTGRSNETLRIDVLTFVETYSAHIFLEESLTDNLFFTESVVVIGPGALPTVNVVNLNDNLVFTQTVNGLDLPAGFILAGPYPAEIFPEHVFSYHVFPRVTFVPGANSYPVHIKDKLNLTETLNGFNPSLNDTDLTQTLFLQDYFRVELGRYVYHFHDQLQFEQELSYTTFPQFFKDVEDTLIFTQTLHPTLKLRRTLTDHLSLNQDNIRRNIEGISINVIGLIGTVTNKGARYVKLESGNSIILLPSPLFGDTQSNVADLKINRAVNGKVYTLVKRTQRQRLSYKFEIRRQKSFELQTFIDNNNLDWIRVTNWRGELYYCKFVNNPISYEAISRDGRCLKNNEKHTVELELEGYLINSQIGACE